MGKHKILLLVPAYFIGFTLSLFAKSYLAYEVSMPQWVREVALGPGIFLMLIFYWFASGAATVFIIASYYENYGKKT